MTLSLCQTYQSLLCMPVAALLLCGCSVNSQPYPSNWSPAITSQQVCPDLTGRYQVDDVDCKPNQCESLYNKLPVPNIPGRSLTRDLPAVEFDGVREGRLQIYYPKRGDGRGNSFELRQGKDFQCKDGELVFEIPGRVMVGDGAFGRENATYRNFSKTNDGALVMRESVSGGGIIFLVIPVYTSNESWVRWLPDNE